MSDTTTSTPTTGRNSVWLHGIIAAVVAAAATAGIGAVALASGVSLIDQNHPEAGVIPPSGFAVLTFGFSLFGVALAAILSRTASHPRKVFVVTTLVLLALSLVPDFTDILARFDTATSLTLAAAHLVAGAIVIPVLAGRLRP